MLFRWLRVLSLTGFLIAGCRPHDQIAQYAIPKYDAIQLPAEKPTGGSSGSTESQPERMLGAIVPHGEQTWFFKLSGSPDRVGEQVEQFQAFVQSLQFGGDGNPTWTLPAGWTQEPGSGMRFATVVVNAGPPRLELTVIALPTAAGSPQEQVLANVNRWRGQVSLPPIAAAALADETQTFTLAGGDLATVVDYTGTSKPGGMTPPFAAGGGLGGPFNRRDTPSAAPATGFSAETPSGWTTGKVGGLRKAAFTIEDGNDRAEVTVIDLARDAGDRLANVNRWRGQVGLEPTDADGLSSLLERIDVGDAPGDFVELAGPQGETILGAIVDRGEKTWFFKLQGPAALASAQKAAFQAYVRSVRWQ